MQKGFGLIGILIIVGIIVVLGAVTFKAGYFSRNPVMPTGEEKSAIKQTEEVKNLLEEKNNNTAAPNTVAEKLHPRLKEIIEQELPDDYVEVIINLRESASREDIIKSFQSYDVAVIEQYSIINGFLARVPVKNIESIAVHPDVLSVSPQFSGEPPPSSQ